MESAYKSLEKLAEVVGMDAAIKLCEAYGGETVYIPMMKTVKSRAVRDKIRREYDGMNIVALAKKYNLSARRVRQITEGVTPYNLLSDIEDESPENC